MVAFSFEIVHCVQSSCASRDLFKFINKLPVADNVVQMYSTNSKTLGLVPLQRSKRTRNTD
jgi:hypothetical protein